MTKDNVDLICDIAELATLFEETNSLEEFLDRVVRLVADHMKVDVCSVYLFEEDREQLVLRATTGLNTAAVGTLALHLGEGITGMALEKLRPIRVGSVEDSRYFKRIPGLCEEPYSAMLAVPILRASARIGVLTVNHERPEFFNEQDTKALNAIAAQLASTLENIRLLLELRRVQGAQAVEISPPVTPRSVKGSPGAKGIVLGEVIQIGRLTDEVWFDDWDRQAQPLTHTDLSIAIEITERQLAELQRQIETDQADLAASFIFGAHQLMLKDQGFIGAIKLRLDQGLGVTQAIISTVNEYAQVFAAAPDPVFQEKAQDVKDLGYRLLRNLNGTTEDKVDYSGKVIVAADLFPSDILRFATQGAAGIVLLGGSPTAHVSVLSRSLSLPMVTVSDERVLQFKDGMAIILDGSEGKIFPDPSECLWTEYQNRVKRGREIGNDPPASFPVTQTIDGVQIRLLATINLLRELKVACRAKAEGIGLYRTEFPFIMRNNFPSEEEQYRVYRKVVKTMRGKAVTFRTLDVGGDKFLDYYPHTAEANPFLGLRAIRFTLRNQQIFEQQLRALLRSGKGASLRIMFPFVSSIDDYLQAKLVLEKVVEQLTKEGAALWHNIEVGAMIELPSAVEIIEELAAATDFLSIGTNDLIQYLLAVDRTNALVSDLYVSHHPAVLRTLKRIADAARRHEKDFSVCGEMASDSRLLPFLLGIGVRCVSVDPDSISQVRTRISQIDTLAARVLADEVLRLSKISEIDARLNAFEEGFGLRNIK